jgi:hypothetical protein
MTRRLIETWLPIACLGVESLRGRTPMKADHRLTKLSTRYKARRHQRRGF